MAFDNAKYAEEILSDDSLERALVYATLAEAYARMASAAAVIRTSKEQADVHRAQLAAQMGAGGGRNS